MSGLTNDYLERTAKRLLGSNFLGVFSADGYKKSRRKKSFSIIFNTDLMKNPGKHFVAIHVSRNSLDYFDSFGSPNIEKNISKFIKKTKKKCFMHCEAIQDVESSFCGFYSLAFLLWMNKRRKNSSCFYDMFKVGSNLQVNDEIVIKYILDQIK